MVGLINAIKLAAVIEVQRDEFVFCVEKFFLKNPIFADSLPSRGYHQIDSPRKLLLFSWHPKHLGQILENLMRAIGEDSYIDLFERRGSHPF